MENDAFEVCESVNPDNGVRCELRGPHDLHIAVGTPPWTNKDVLDAMDSNKMLIKEVRKMTAAIDRLAAAAEHYVMEAFHKQR